MCLPLRKYGLVIDFKTLLVLCLSCSALNSKDSRSGWNLGLGPILKLIPCWYFPPFPNSIFLEWLIPKMGFQPGVKKFSKKLLEKKLYQLDKSVDNFKRRFCSVTSFIPILRKDGKSAKIPSSRWLRRQWPIDFWSQTSLL